MRRGGHGARGRPVWGTPSPRATLVPRAGGAHNAGVGLYAEHVLPRILHFAMARRLFEEQRPRCVGAARGRVLEVGFGSGFNLPHYGRKVSEVLAVEPSALSRRLAAPLVSRSPLPVRYLAPERDRLPLEDASVDSVVSTWTLCTVPDLHALLVELGRLLRPGGRLLFLEHGRSPDARVARWQDRLTPLQRRLAGGCHLNRAIPELVGAAGFALERLEEFDLAGPRVGVHMFLGSARGPAG